MLERRPNNWAGWENWLTVDIVRQLNDKSVLPFYSYPRSTQKLDIYIEKPRPLAVEIKVTYLTDNEATDHKRLLTNRVAADAEKLTSLPNDIGRVLLLAACFESSMGRSRYTASDRSDLLQTYASYTSRWYNCSSQSGGHIALLVLSTLSRLPQST